MQGIDIDTTVHPCERRKTTTQKAAAQETASPRRLKMRAAGFAGVLLAAAGIVPSVAAAQSPSLVFSASSQVGITASTFSLYATTNNCKNYTNGCYGGNTGHLITDSYGDQFFVNNAYSGNGFLVELPAGNGAAVQLMSGLSNGSSGLAKDPSGNLYVANGNQGVIFFPLVSGVFPTNVDSTKLAACTLPISSTTTTACTFPINSAGTGYYYQFTDLAVDGSGNLYLATNYDNNSGHVGGGSSGANIPSIYKVSASSGAMTQLIKNTVGQSGNGQITADALGDVFYADSNGALELPVSNYNNVVHLGTGLTDPSGVALDSSNNLYIADEGTQGSSTAQAKIVEIPYKSGIYSNSTQFVLTEYVSSSGTGGPSYSPAIDGQGNVYYSIGNQIFQVKLGSINLGTNNTYYTPSAGLGSQALTGVFSSATTIASTKIVGASASAFSLNSSGTTCVAGSFAAGATCTFQVYYVPTVPGPQSATLLIYGPSSVLVGQAQLIGYGQANLGTIDPPAITAVGGSWAAPSAVATDSLGDAFVADSSTGKIYESIGGAAQTVVASGFNAPSAVVVDSVGDLYVGDSGNGQVVKIPYVNSAYGTAVAVATGLSGKSGLVLDVYNNLYIADSGNARVLLVTTSGSTSTVGSGWQTPVAVALDGLGDLFVSDNGLKKVIQVNLNNGTLTTLVSGLSTAGGLATEPGGSLFVMDSGAKTIKLIPNNGSGTLTPGSAFTLSSIVTAPSAMTADFLGNLYVVDATNKAVANANRVTGALSFGNVNVNATSPTLTATVFNSGTSPTKFYGEPINGAAPFGFPPASSCTPTEPSGTNYTLAVSATCQQQVTFSPTAAGAATQTVEINSDQHGTGVYDYTAIALSGTGVQTSTTTITGATSVVYGASSSYTVKATPDGTYAVGITGTATASGSVTVSGGTGTFALPALGVGNYTLSVTAGGQTGTASVGVTPAPLTLTAGSFSRLFDTPNPVFTYSYSGFVNGDTAATAVTGTPSITTAATRSSPAAIYQIVAGVGTAVAANYTIGTTNGSLNVTGNTPQTIVFLPLAGFTHGTTVQLLAYSSSGLSLTYTATGGTISGTTLTIGAAGTVTVTAAQAGNASYAAATSVSQSFTAKEVNSRIK